MLFAQAHLQKIIARGQLRPSGSTVFMLPMQIPYTSTKCNEIKKLNAVVETQGVDSQTYVENTYFVTAVFLKLRLKLK